MFWYANVFFERSEQGDDNSKHSERKWILRAIENTVSGRENSDWRDASGSEQKFSKHLLWEKRVFLTYPLLCGNVLFCCSLYFSTYMYPLLCCYRCLSVSSVCGVHPLFHWDHTRTPLKITFFWRKKYFGSVYINPTSFVPLYYPFLQTLNHPSITYQYGILTMGQARKPWGINIKSR